MTRGEEAVPPLPDDGGSQPSLSQVSASSQSASYTSAPESFDATSPYIPSERMDEDDFVDVVDEMKTSDQVDMVIDDVLERPHVPYDKFFEDRRSADEERMEEGSIDSLNMEAGEGGQALGGLGMDLSDEDDLEEGEINCGGPCLVSIDSLKHGFFENSDSVTLRLLHKQISIEQIVLHEDSCEIYFTCENEEDNLLGRYGECVSQREFIWHVRFAGAIYPDQLEVGSNGRELTMRKMESGTQWGRLASSTSTSNIRSSNYARPSYTSGISSYRYSPSSSTYLSTTTSPPTSLLPTSYTRYQYSPSSSSRLPPYSPSTFTATSGYASSTSTSSRLGRDVSADPPPQGSPTVRSRSTSAISSYRKPSVTQLNRQAAERAQREKEYQEQKEWEEREAAKEKLGNIPPPPPMPPSSSPASSTSSGSLQGRRPPPYSASSSSLITAASTSPSKYSDSTYTPTKPMAKVPPYEERGTVVNLGFTGLRNIGNTCFMNATLQMLVNTIELRTYFLEKYYKGVCIPIVIEMFRKEVNATNPLGFRGRLAEAFAELMKQMWSGMNRAIEPAQVKELVAERASQFANFAQHDAHEFLAFLLDGLHEDVNRVKKKPLTSTIEADGRPDEEVSTEAWANYQLRNDSIFVDLFHGQLKSRLHCPKCDKVSITFDPFVYLPVPFPKVKKTAKLYYWPIDPHLAPIKLQVQYSADGTILDLLNAVGDLVKANGKDMRMLEAYSSRVQHLFRNDEKITSINHGDVLHVFQVHSTSDCGEEVVELAVVQRLLYHRNLPFECSHCHKQWDGLKACEACYNVYYCNKSCQTEHWSHGHRDECKRRPVGEAVGQPFIVSLPRSRLTFAHLSRVLESRCRFSTNVFQLPVNETRGGSEEPKDEKEREREEEDELYASGPRESAKQKQKSQSSVSSKESRTGTEVESGGRSRRQVIPEPRAKKVDSKLFVLRHLNDFASSMGTQITEKEKNEPLNLPNGSIIAMNFSNLRNGRPFVTAETKDEIDVDKEQTDRLARLTSTLSANSGGPVTLQDMLVMFSETERLKPEEAWRCSGCKEHVEATKQLILYRLPPILIVQLKRFVYTGSASMFSSHRRLKDERRVVYPHTDLDLEPYLCQSAPRPPSTHYDLTGVVCHSGSSYFGHYISMGRLAGFDATRTEIEWRNFDDSMVSRINSQSAQSDDAYLLFYKMRGSSTADLFVRRYGASPSTHL